jgi:formylglycine-generating enzyme required for sulfatase activity
MSVLAWVLRGAALAVALAAWFPLAPAAGQGSAEALKPGAEFKDCANCPAMVVIPAGRFSMGSPKDDPDARANERPRHEVSIASPIAVSKFEATFDEWDACAAAGVCPPASERWGRGGMPIINVSWNDARQYAAWLARITGRPYRLLTEAEWEYAARAGAVTRYIPGAMALARAQPIATAAGAAGISNKLRPSARSSRTRSGSTTCRATSGSGSRTRGATITGAP